MARYFINGGINNNWGDTSNWSDTSGGAGGFSVPTASDDVYLDGNSPNCVVNANNRVCLSIDFTGYANTFSEDSTARTLTVSGNVTLGSGATYTFAGTLIVNATATLTSNGSSWSGNLTLPTALSTSSFADNWYIIGTLSASNTTLEGGKTISVEGNVTTPVNNGLPSSYCTIKFVNNGTQTLSTLGAMRANILIDKSGGSLTMLDASASGIRFFAPSFVVAGTNSGTITPPALITFNIAATSIDTSVISWNDVTFTILGGHTLTSALNIYGDLKYNTAAQLDGADVNLYKGFDHTSSGSGSGTSNFYFLGSTSGTFQCSGAGSLRNNVTINKSGGTLTIGTNLRYNTGTLTYTSGTVDTTSNSSTLTIAASTTLNTNGIVWNNVTFATTAGVYTLTTDFTVNGTFTQSSGSNQTFNGADMYCNGNVVVYASTGTVIIGTTDFFFAGTGTWSGRQAFASNLTITGTYTISGTVAISGNCTFTCTTGTLITTGSTFEIPSSSAANVVINTNQTLNNFGSGTATITLSQALVITGTLAYLNNATITINGFSITIGGSLTLPTAAIATGTTDLILNGTGTWSGSTLRNNLTINTAGTITISGNVGYNTGTLTYTAGTVITTGSTLTVAANTTLNTNGMSFGNISLTAALTLTINSLLSANGTLTLPNANITFAGTSGWSVHTLSQTASLGAARTYTFVAGKTYTITNQFTVTGSRNTLRALFVSSVGGTRAILTLAFGAAQNVGYTNATDIDSSLGQTVYSFNGVLSNTLNWNTLTQPRQHNYIFQH